MGNGLNEAESSKYNADIKAISSNQNIKSKEASEYGNVQRRGLVQFQPEDESPEPEKKKQRPLTAKERALKKKESEVNSTTRWLADSAFTTYFGKPPFHAYGKGNTNPTSMASKMLTHNINGATGSYKITKDQPNADTLKAEYQQVYDSALRQSLKKNGGTRVPKLPRKSAAKR